VSHEKTQSYEVVPGTMIVATFKLLIAIVSSVIVLIVSPAAPLTTSDTSFWWYPRGQITLAVTGPV
jgi:hypothetical protein